MTEADFRKKRRRQFLTESIFEINMADELFNVSENLKLDEYGITRDSPAYPGVFRSTFISGLGILKLGYTAGVAIENIQPLYLTLVKYFSAWHDAYRIYISELASETGKELHIDGTPLHFEDLFEFQLVMDVASIGILLGLGDAVRSVATLLERIRGTDMTFEALIEPAVEDPRDVEEFFHEKPYGLFLDALYTARTPEEQSAFMKKYLENWYKSFEGVPWHDGHLRSAGGYSNYAGYWAFDAAAACVIHGIDDSSFRDHIVYPKDLADWARAHNVLEAVRPGLQDDQGKLRCAAGSACPRDGYWLTPAAESSRRYFQNGEIMPDLGGDYGATIWQWDADQSA